MCQAFTCWSSYLCLFLAVLCKVILPILCVSRKLPIQEFSFSRLLQDIGLTNEQVGFAFKNAHNAGHYTSSPLHLDNTNKRLISPPH